MSVLTVVSISFIHHLLFSCCLDHQLLAAEERIVYSNLSNIHICMICMNYINTKEIINTLLLFFITWTNAHPTLFQWTHSLFSLQSRPLTRYLPVRKDDFDLRAHIESAGHSPDTCFHLSISEKTCRGYLIKMGGKIKTWKKRWFVFDRNRRTLSYYSGRGNRCTKTTTWRRKYTDMCTQHPHSTSQIYLNTFHIMGFLCFTCIWNINETRSSTFANFVFIHFVYIYMS